MLKKKKKEKLNQKNPTTFKIEFIAWNMKIIESKNVLV